jgi:1,5-anhydro-D-fructose reductase (1,5-anhydro-D-mannitol-forming)
MSDRKVNWAIVGVGDIVRKRVGAAILQQPDSVLHACVEIDHDGRRAQIDALAPRKVYTDINQMLADPAVDAVYIATPVHLHASQAIAALRAGKDVLVEKPMACNIAEATEMCRIADQTGRRLAVAYFRRFWSRFQLVKDMLDRGEFGQVVLVRVASHTWYAGNSAGWREKPELAGGGVLSDVGCHKFDLLAWWFGLPSRVIARVETLTQKYAVEDSAVLLMTLAGGAQLTASFHWNSKTWTDEIHIVGTEAKVTFHPCDGDEAVITVGRDTNRREMPPPENQHYPLVDDFTRSIVEDRRPRFTGDDGLLATRIMETAFESSRRNTWVENS